MGRLIMYDPDSCDEENTVPMDGNQSTHIAGRQIVAAYGSGRDRGARQWIAKAGGSPYISPE